MLRLTRTTAVDISQGDRDPVVLRFATPTLVEGQEALALLESLGEGAADLGDVDTQCRSWLRERYRGGDGAIDIDGDTAPLPAPDDPLADELIALLPFDVTIAIVRQVAVGRAISGDRLGKFAVGPRSSPAPDTSVTDAPTPSEPSGAAGCPSETPSSAVVRIEAAAAAPSRGT